MTTTRTATTVLGGLDALRPSIEDLYRDLHQHPELCHRGAADPRPGRQRLRTAGFEVTTASAALAWSACCATGRTDRTVAGGHGRVAGAEQTGLPYASTVRAPTGRNERAGDARLRPRHARQLPARRRPLARGGRSRRWHGTVIALFQPAEETGDGAAGMLEDHLSELVPHTRRRRRPARPPVRGRTSRTPGQTSAVLGRQHADHRLRPWRPRVDAAGRGRPGRAPRIEAS